MTVPRREEIKFAKCNAFLTLYKSFGDGSMMDYGHFIYFPKEETQKLEGWKGGPSFKNSVGRSRILINVIIAKTKIVFLRDRTMD